MTTVPRIAAALALVLTVTRAPAAQDSPKPVALSGLVEYQKTVQANGAKLRKQLDQIKHCLGTKPAQIGDTQSLQILLTTTQETAEKARKLVPEDVVSPLDSLARYLEIKLSLATASTSADGTGPADLRAALEAQLELVLQEIAINEAVQKSIGAQIEELRAERVRANKLAEFEALQDGAEKQHPSPTPQSLPTTDPMKSAPKDKHK